MKRNTKSLSHLPLLPLKINILLYKSKRGAANPSSRRTDRCEAQSRRGVGRQRMGTGAACRAPTHSWRCSTLGRKALRPYNGGRVNPTSPPYFNSINRRVIVSAGSSPISPSAISSSLRCRRRFILILHPVGALNRGNLDRTRLFRMIRGIRLVDGGFRAA